MSLLHDVLKPTSNVDQVTAKLNKLTVPSDDSTPSSRGQSPTHEDNSDDELIGVVSAPGTPRRGGSRPISRSTSPTRTGASTRRAPGPLHISSSTPSTKRSPTDPLRVLTTDLTQRIFAQLPVKDLASASRVSLKWSKSQSLNYLWFQHYRKTEFGDQTLPSGKWTRRESKENWRKIYLKTARQNAEQDGTASRYGYSTPPLTSSGYATPREVREERWAQENGADGAAIGKVEMREMYKELGGRKARTKSKFGGARDRGGWYGSE